MPSVTTSGATTQDRDAPAAIAAWWHAAKLILSSIGRFPARGDAARAAARDRPDTAWYDDPGASRGL